MFIQFFWIILLVLLTVSVHMLYSVSFLLRLHKLRQAKHGMPHSLRGYIPVLGGIVVFLMLMHFVEVFIWAVFYALLGGLPDLETALYFSLSSYTTIGYGDVLPAQSMRLVGASEGLVGTFMCGWSVAILVAILQEIARDSVTRLSSGSSRRKTPH